MSTTIRQQIMRLKIWILNNKFAASVLLVLLFLLVRGSIFTPMRFTGASVSKERLYVDYGDHEEGYKAPLVGTGKSAAEPFAPPVSTDEAPPVFSANRMVVQNSNLSLVVKNVSEALQSIKQQAQNAGGYMVEGNLTNPGQDARATITVRIPENQLEPTLSFYRSLAVKVVSENLKGKDVTDQYEDIDEKLRILEQNKARFEEIMAQADEISDILKIQREIFNAQSQIDQLRGRQKSLAQNASLTKITVYLSTDEYSLPYAPSEAWRPEVIFKHAVRSLVGLLRNLGTIVIWAAVYSVAWAPVLLAVWYVRKRKKTKKAPPLQQAAP